MLRRVKRLLVVFAAVLAGAGACAPKGASVPPAAGVERVDSVSQLARAFDAAEGKPKFVTILSPT